MLFSGLILPNQNLGRKDELNLYHAERWGVQAFSNNVLFGSLLWERRTGGNLLVAVGIGFVAIGIVVVVAAFPVIAVAVACAVIDDDDSGLDKAMAIVKNSFGCINKAKTTNISNKERL